MAGFTITGGSNSGIVGGGPKSVVEYCHITGNTGGTPFAISGLPPSGDTRQYGGGIYGCQGLIQNNIIECNSAMLGGGLAFCNGTIQNNIIARNRLVGYGGNGACGAALYACGGTIRGNTIVDNAVGQYVSGGPYQWLGGGLVNCTGPIYNNLIWVSRPDLTPEYVNCAPPSFSCIKGWKGEGLGNLTADPHLVNAAFDETPGPHTWPTQDWRLKPESPCIDAGQTTAGLTVDFSGKPRGKVWRIQGKPGHTDIGAMEFDPGPISLWVPANHDPATAGTTLYVHWALAAGVTPVGFNLSLMQGSTIVATLGKAGTAANHSTYETAGWWAVTLPRDTPAASDYVISGLSATGSVIAAKTTPFAIQRYNTVDSRSWNLYY